jgi:hypothetical protein
VLDEADVAPGESTDVLATHPATNRTIRSRL